MYPISERIFATAHCCTRETCEVASCQHSPFIDKLARIARYAAAYARSCHPPTPPISSSSKAVTNASGTSPVLQAPAVLRATSRSYVELHSVDTSIENANIDKRDRGWPPHAYSESPSQAGHRQPNIFPGVVRRRTRRRSLRQSSGSDNGYDPSSGIGVGLSRTGILERDGNCPPVAAHE